MEEEEVVVTPSNSSPLHRANPNKAARTSARLGQVVAARRPLPARRHRAAPRRPPGPSLAPSYIATAQL